MCPSAAQAGKTSRRARHVSVSKAIWDASAFKFGITLVATPLKTSVFPHPARWSRRTNLGGFLGRDRPHVVHVVHVVRELPMQRIGFSRGTIRSEAQERCRPAEKGMRWEGKPGTARNSEDLCQRAGGRTACHTRHGGKRPLKSENLCPAVPRPVVKVNPCDRARISGNPGAWAKCVARRTMDTYRVW